MAALLLGRLLPRPDMQQALAGFVAWAHEAVAGGRGPEAAFVLPGLRAVRCTCLSDIEPFCVLLAQ